MPLGFVGDMCGVSCEFRRILIIDVIFKMTLRTVETDVTKHATKAGKGGLLVKIISSSRFN